MLWDRNRILPVKALADRRRALILWVSETTLPSAIAQACDLAAINVLVAKNFDICLSHVAAYKPDLVLQDIALTGTWPDFINHVAKQRVTPSLPVLDFVGEPNTFLNLGPKSNTAEALLTIKGLLRRERPCALNDTRQVGEFSLDVASFKLFHATDWVGISKADLCILGPFFDVPDIVFDRCSLARLVFGSTGMCYSSRTIDAQVSRMRRYVNAHLGVDPIRSVRGVGYALASDNFRSHFS